MTRATYLKMIGLMLVLTVLQSVILVNIDWNGMQGSAEADEIDLLLDVMIVPSAFVFAVVCVMLGYCVYKYKAKPGDESDGKPIHGNTKLEIAWTVIPTIIVLFAAAYSWTILDDIEAEASDQMEINVTAQQFKWTFEYPETGVVADELHVVSGRQLELHLTSLEVLHSFWVPEWRIKRDLVPIADGNPTDVDNIVRVTPDVPGNYALVCTEYCGWGHATMRAPVVVESQAEFDKWMAEQEESQAGTPTEAQADEEAAIDDEGASDE